ncbi:hypothetical protein CNEO_470054 [Clostridium neonatale]|nr:hypothetical protein CNEO_470054 [Clostridium neonatale]
MLNLKMAYLRWIKIKINMRCILIEHQTAHWDKKIKIKINMRCI